MTQPTERRFVMEPRLDAEVETLNLAIDAEETARIAGDALKVAKAGDTMTGALTLNADPTNALHAATKQYVDNVTINTDNLGDIDYIQFDTTYAGGSTAAGMLAWDQDNETLEFMLDDHVTLQIGQEHVIRVKNNSDSVAIPERTVVMFAGATGDTIKVSPAVSDGSINVNYLAGITTEEIPAGGFGFITQLGFINQVNTNTWPVGTLLYVDPATPGGLTATEPDAPAWTMPVAAVTKQNASAGRILVRSIPGGSGAGGGAAVNVADTAPVGGNPGDMWFDSTDGTLYVYYEDVDGSQWVQVQANSALTAGIESRVGALESQAIAYGAMSPNYIINGGMDIWQRGTSFTNPAAWTSWSADRWMNGYDGSGATRIVSQQNHTPGSEPYAGAKYFLRWNQTVAGTGGTYNIITHRVEDVRTLASKTATISFWAKASANSACAVDLEQCFGTGGSANVYTQFGSFTATTSWQRFTFTITVPSISGKTIGSAGNDYIAPRFFFPVNTVMSFDLCGVQLEVGNTATSFRRNSNSLQAELAACQRYYYRLGGTTPLGGSFSSIAIGTPYASTGARMVVRFPVQMRTSPTQSTSGSFQCSPGTFASVAADGLSAEGAMPTLNGSGFTAGGSVILYANGSSIGYIDFSAEL